MLSPAPPRYASPAVYKLARELGVPLAQVPGSAAHGRITAEDVRSFVKRRLQGDLSPASTEPVATEDFAQFGPVERHALSPDRMRSGAALQRSWTQIPQTTNHADADITALEAFRVALNREQGEAGVEFTLLSFIIKACVVALKQYPQFNASLAGETLILKRYYHIGLVIDSSDGPRVPVIRNADRKGLLSLAKEIAALAPQDMAGGSFSIASLGAIGGTYFTPIINAPEVAILGVGHSHTRVVWQDGLALPRLILPLSLSWDQRAVDATVAARFNACLAEVLADFRLALL
jgi:pyruvate dehydrogenase E2 component (dihydrolipoamide acetyltransferase)